MSKVLKITLIVLTSLLILLAGITFALRTRTVQVWIIEKVTDYLSRELKTKVTLAGVNVRFFDKVDLLDLYIEDRQGDTLFYFERLGVQLQSYNTDKRLILLKKLELIGTRVHFALPKGAEDFNYQFIIDYFNQAPSEGGGSWVIKSRKVVIRDTDFRMWNKNSTPPESRKFDENHIHFYGLNADLERFVLVDDSIRFKSVSFACREKSGLRIANLKTDATIWSEGMIFDSLLLQTARSTLRHRLAFKYDHYNQFNDFIDSVKLDVGLSQSRINLQELGYFSNELLPFNYSISLSGNATGVVSNFKTGPLEIAYGNSTKLLGKVKIKGLPDIDNAFIDADIRQLTSKPSDIKTLVKNTELPKEINTLGVMTFDGRFTGFISDFVAYGNLSTDLGTLSSDINMKIPEKGPAVYVGNLQTDGFDLGKLYSGAGLGKTGFELNLDGKGFTMNDFDAKIDGSIQAVDWNHYTYKGIELNGRFIQKYFTGNASIDDENIQLTFKGDINLNEALPVYDFEAEIAHADLFRLHLDTATESKIQSRVSVQLRGDELDNLSGTAKLKDFEIRRSGRTFFLRETSLFSASVDNKRMMIFNSDIADITIQGEFAFSGLGLAYKEFMSTLFPEMYPELDGRKTPVRISFISRFKRPDILSSILNSRLTVSPGYASGNYNSIEESLNFKSNFDSVRWDDIVIKDWDINLKKEPGELLNLSTEILALNQANITRVNYLLLNASILPNYIDFTLMADDKSHDAHFFTYGHSKFSKDSIMVQLEDGLLSVYEKTWKIANANKVEIAGGNTHITDFSLLSDKERLDLNGYVYKDDNAEMSLWLKDFDLKILSPLIGSETLDKVSGVTNGTLNVSGKWYEPVINSDLIIENLTVNTDTLGNFKLITKASGSSPLEMDIYSTMQEGLLKDMEIIGKINLGVSDQNLDLKMTWRNGEIKPIGQFFKGVASDFRGRLSASVYVGGTFDDPTFTGTALLDSCSFLVDYTNVRYALKGSMTVSDKKFAMNYMEITDPFNNGGNVSGAIVHDFFDDFYLDVKMSNLRNFMGLNTKKGDNELFYGTAMLDGSCAFKGPLDDIYMNINAKSRKGTRIFIPLEWETDNTSVGFISFEKPGEEEGKLSRNADLEGFRMDFNFELTPEAYIEMIFDELMDDRIKGSGNGNLKMEINTFGDFSMYGDYVIETGQYHFTALNFISKEFNITNGSKITWDGNPYDGKMNIEAVKRENAAPADLLAGLVPDDQLINYRTKIPVDCQLFLKGLLFSPDISFGLSFPNQSNAANTGFNTFNSVVSRIQTDPEELNRQVFSLLVLGSFIPPGFASGSTGFAATSGIQNTVNNSVGDLISNQVSNWISQLDSRWQIGIDWQSASEATKKELIFSVKRKFLNDRLEFDGSVDANAINGRNPYNLNIQYNITSDGRFKVRGFSKFANDPTLGVVSNIFTTGVGFSYRKQFNQFRIKKKQPTSQPAPAAVKPKEEEN